MVEVVVVVVDVCVVFVVVLGEDCFVDDVSFDEVVVSLALACLAGFGVGDSGEDGGGAGFVDVGWVVVDV